MKRLILAFFVIPFMFAVGIAYAAETGGEQMELNTFDKVAKETALKDGVREITYDQFMSIRNSGEKYILLDVLAPESYADGHIDGAASFPVNTIDEGTALSRLKKGDKIIVYCGSFQCHASTMAAQKLEGLGYTVLDYKGGLKEWQEKGNQLVK